jgi:peptidyl-prolyl cis-trans isomerase SurA
MNVQALRRLERTRWLGFVSAALLLNAGVARAEIVDRVVAVIDRDVITLSEAEQASEFRALRGQDALLLEDLVERLIESRLIEREVGRYPEEAVPEQQVDAAVDSLEASLPSPTAFSAALSARGLTEEELALLIRRQLTIQRYLESRFRPLVFVTDDEVERYYDNVLLPDVTAAGESPPPLASVEGGIRRILEERVFNQRIDEWIARLKSRSRVRRYVW